MNSRCHQRVFCARNKKLGEHTEFQMLDRLHDPSKEPKGIKRRSKSLGERLQNKIRLVFNLVVQRDSRIIVQMGENSRKDSNNMRSIAVVGLVYLPGTFISGLFGMNFSQFSGDTAPQTWVVSEKLRLYWTVTELLTLLTIIIWFATFYGDAAKR